MAEQLKYCKKCNTEKPVSRFGICMSKKDGMQSTCKDCRSDYYKSKQPADKPEKIALSTAECVEKKKKRDREYSKEYRKLNSDKIKKYVSLYAKENKDLISSRKKEYNDKNREKVLLKCAQYRASHTKECRESTRKWKLENKEACRIKEQNRRSIKNRIGGALSKGLVAKLFSLQKGRCACCGAGLGDNYHMDHIMPLALGGENIDSNIQLLRQKCNNQKYSKHPVDFMQQRGFLL